MGHFGPEVTLARRLVDTGRRVAIFKYTLGATSLMRDWKSPGEGGMYDQMVKELQRACKLLEDQGHKPVCRGFFWIQGESDAETNEMANGYLDRLRLLVSHFRNSVVKNPKLPVVLGVDEQHPYVAEHPQVIEAQRTVAREAGNAVFTSMIGLEKADSTHLTPRGLEEHGNRLAAAFLSLISGT